MRTDGEARSGAVALLAGCLFCHSAGAADPRTAANNAGHEMIECAAYFAIVARGMRNTPNERSAAGAEQYDAASKDAIVYAVNYAQLIGQKEEAVVARMELTMKDLLNKMGNDYVNISVLMKEYMEPCLSVMEDPAARLDYWMSK